MIEVFVFGVVFIIMFLLYRLTTYTHLVVDAITGDPYDYSTITKSYKTRYKIVELNNGEYINTKNCIVAHILGNNLSHQGIFYGDKWLIDPKEIPVPGNIVLIKWNRQDIYVLRRVENIASPVITVSWRNDKGEDIEEICTLASVLGVIKYNLIDNE